MTSRWEHLARRIVLSTAGTAGALLVLAMALSYTGLRAFYLGAGLPGWAASLYPLTVDLLALVGYVALLVLAGKTYPAAVVAITVLWSAAAQGYHLSHGGVTSTITDGRVTFLAGASAMVCAGLSGHLVFKILERALPAGFITAMQEQAAPPTQLDNWTLKTPVAELAQELAAAGYPASSTPWRKPQIHQPSNHWLAFDRRMDGIEREARDRQAEALDQLPPNPPPVRNGYLPGELDAITRDDPAFDLEPDGTEQDGLATVTAIPGRKTIGADVNLRQAKVTARAPAGKSQEDGPCDPRCDKHPAGTVVSKSTRYRCKSRLDAATAR